MMWKWEQDNEVLLKYSTQAGEVELIVFVLTGVKIDLRDVTVE